MKFLLALLLLTSTLSAESYKITFVGDIVLGQDYRFRGKTFDWQWSLLNGTPVQRAKYFMSEKVRNILQTDDLTVANFEGTIFGDDIKPNKDKKFVFHAKPEYLPVLSSNGIDLVNLANNHAPYDYGNEGFEATKETIGFLPLFGVQSYGYNVLYPRKPFTGVGDICICGLEAFHTFNVVKEKVDRNIKKMKEERGCRYIVFTFHWGTERQYQNNGFQARVAHYVIDQGADLVVGHHPHVVQNIEEYKGKKIVYSLGNFIFGGNRNPKDKEAIMFQVTLSTDYGRDKYDYIEQYEVIPVYTSSVTYRNDYRVILQEER